jgi:ABC-type phosphate transport system substrate-binding protein
LVKKAIVVGTAIAASGAWVAVSAPNAHAAGDVIAAEGADVTGPVMSAILQGTGAVNVTTPIQLGSTEVTVPGDSFCSAVTYNASGTGTDSGGNPKIAAAPASQQGIDALNNSVAKTYPGPFAYTGVASSVGGCIDIARSSSLNKTPSILENYAFAVDAVTWASPSLYAPAYLTLQQLRDIWNCNYNDWSQVGGSPGPILRALPFFGSGTRKFFLNNIIGVPSSGSAQPVESGTTGWIAPTSGNIPAGQPNAGAPVTCPPAIGSGNTTGLGEQSNGANLSTPAFRADLQKYILPYSAGNWVAQANNAGNPTLDIRGGVRPGGIVGVAPTGTFPPAYAVRWTGTAWRLNDGTILGNNETHGRTVTAITSDGQFDTTLTGAPGSFAASDVGFNLQSPTEANIVNDGTVITAVSADGSQATISPGAKAAGTSDLLLGWAVVSEKNPNISGAGTGTGTQYPGVRFVYNIIRPDEPSYLAARALIGFDDTASNGAVSALCNGDDAGTLSDYGFLPLTPLDPSGPGVGNDQAITCRKQ